MNEGAVIAAAVNEAAWASRFARRRALVTGAGGGIGRAVARAFARQGGAVALLGRTVASLEETARLIRVDRAIGADRGGATTEAATTAAASTVAVVVADLCDAASVQRAMDETVARLGGLDIVVNNAGTFETGPLLELDLDRWDALIRSNLSSVFLVCRAAAPHLRRGASIVNVSSALGARPSAGVGAYSVCKAGVNMLTQSLALELGGRGVRVNAVLPAIVATDLFIHAGKTPAESASFLAQAATLHPLGRVGEPDDIAAAVLFLASDEATWITGALFPVDGGRTLVSGRP